MKLIRLMQKTLCLLLTFVFFINTNCNSYAGGHRIYENLIPQPRVFSPPEEPGSEADEREGLGSDISPKGKHLKDRTNFIYKTLEQLVFVYIFVSATADGEDRVESEFLESVIRHHTGSFEESLVNTILNDIDFQGIEIISNSLVIIPYRKTIYVQILSVEGIDFLPDLKKGETVIEEGETEDLHIRYIQKRDEAQDSDFEEGEKEADDQPSPLPRSGQLPDFGSQLDRHKNRASGETGLQEDNLLRDPTENDLQELRQEIDEYLYANDQDLLEDNEFEILRRIRFIGRTFGTVPDLTVLRYLFTRDSNNRLVIATYLSQSFPDKEIYPDEITISPASIKDTDVEIEHLGMGANRYAYTIECSLKGDEISTFFIKVCQYETHKKGTSGTKDEFVNYQILRTYYPPESEVPFSHIYDTRQIGKYWVQSGEVIRGEDLERVINDLKTAYRSSKKLTNQDLGRIQLITYEIGRLVGNAYARAGILWGDFKPANVVVEKRFDFRPGSFLVKNIDYETVLILDENREKFLAAYGKNLPAHFVGAKGVDRHLLEKEMRGTPEYMIIKELKDILTTYAIRDEVIENLFLAGMCEEIIKARNAPDDMEDELEEVFGYKLDASDYSRFSKLQAARNEILFNDLTAFHESVKDIHNPQEHLNSLEISKLMDEMEDIHNEHSIKLIPKVKEGRTLWHVLPESLIHPSIRSDFRALVREMNHLPGRKEKIKIVNGSEELIDEVSSLASDENNEVIVALDGDKVLNELPKGVKALVFKNSTLNDFVHIEGIISALRALHSGNTKALIELYRILTGEEFSGTEADIIKNINNPKLLSKTIAFILRTVPIIPGKSLDELNRKQLNFLRAA